jgi:hypothetical protein
MTNRAREFLASLGLPHGDAHDLPSSRKRFPDGAHYRVEIPSVEGPAVLQAVLEHADLLGVTVHRISQGSGMMLLTEAEIREMARLGHERGIEVCLFVGPRAGWEGFAQSAAPDGRVFGWRHMGLDQLAFAFEDVQRGVEHGVRSVLVADEGLVWLLDQARQRGVLPRDLVLKASAVLGLANPVGIRLLVEAGVNTVNVASSITLPQLAALRQVIDIPIDLYVEAPDGLGGSIRYYELAEIIRVSAPVYLKFGLRNAPGIYPGGHHLEEIAIRQGRERVHRAAVGLELLARQGEDHYVMSGLHAPDLGIPVL